MNAAWGELRTVVLRQERWGTRCEVKTGEDARRSHFSLLYRAASRAILCWLGGWYVNLGL